MKKKTTTIVMVVLACALVVCVTMMVRSYKKETEGGDIYDEAVDIFLSTQPHEPATTTPPTTAPTAPGDTAPATEATTEPPATTAAATRPVIYSVEDVQVDFEKLQAVNPEIIGWFLIENSTISYPLLQGEDNEKYLNLTYNNKKSSYGSIYLDARMAPDMSMRHSIIFGHNMRNSAMFGQLLKYSDRKFWEQHPAFHIILPDGVLKYQVFSAYKADIEGITYTVRYDSVEDYAAYLEAITALSAVDMGIVPDGKDKIVTLSTCTSVSSEKEDWRYVVHGRLVSDTRGQSAASAEDSDTEGGE